MFTELSSLWRRLRNRVSRSRYDEFTIADYFRDRGAVIGPDCRIYIRDMGPEPWLIRIGRHVTIASGATLLTHDGGTWLFTEQHPTLQHFGPIVIGDNCFIGINSIILPGIRIGDNCVVGAGAVVTRDVPSNTIVVGSPARAVSTTEDYRARLLTAWETQRPPGYMPEFHDGTPIDPTRLHVTKHRDWNLLRAHLQRVFFG
jgi:acetyltransferase-like isoleucine patch superfamily enzyme